MNGIQIVVVFHQRQPQEQWETDSGTDLNGRRDEGNGVLELRRHAQDGLADLLDNIGAVAVVRSDDVEALPSASNGANTLYFSISFSSDYFLQGGETKEHANNVDTTQLRRMRLEHQLVELVQIAR